MKEYIKQGFGFGIGYVLGVSLLVSVAKGVSDALSKPEKEVNQSDSSTKKGEA